MKYNRAILFCAVAIGIILFCASCQSSAKQANEEQSFRSANADTASETVPVTESGYEPYEKVFSSNYKKGKRLATKVLQEMANAGVDSEIAVFAVAIVFPELTRYSAVSNFFETTANRTTINTKKQKNYSIGYMNMTPSFAVDVEKRLAHYDDLQKKYVGINFLGDTSTVQAQQKRLDRLNSLKFQINYLLAFIDVFMRLHDDKVDMWLDAGETSIYTSTKCLAYFATAYNAGFTKHIDVIKPFILRYGFPYGGLDSRSHWNYRSISQTWFAEQLQ